MTERENLLKRTLSGVLLGCDIVFGTTSAVLAIVGVVLLVLGDTHALTVIALWFIPVLNTLWSKLTHKSNRVTADLVRAAVCLPVTTYLYVADSGGLFAQMWIPALMMSVGIALSLGIARRGPTLGFLVTFAYSGSLLLAFAIRHGALDGSVIDDALGIVLTGCIISLVASQFGRTLDEAQHQRDSANEQRARAETTLQQLTERTLEARTSAIESLHREMEHRIRVEEELHQAQKLESVGRLAAGIAHEINTPVQFVSDSIAFVRNAVTDLFELVEKLEIASPTAETQLAAEAADLPYLTEHVPKALDLAIEGLGRVSTIVRSMKEFAHPDPKEMVATPLNRAIESTLTVANNEYKYLAELLTDFGELPPVYCHIGELNQAVLNIVINAAHAIGDVVGTTGRKGRVTVRTRRDGDDAVIEIADTGAGIPDAIRGQIFDPFFTTKEVGRGTGQGLAIARSVIVDKHHGKLTFESELGKGTTFRIRIPIRGPKQLAVAA